MIALWGHPASTLDAAVQPVIMDFRRNREINWWAGSHFADFASVD